MRPSVERCPQHIPISICSKGGLGRSPLKHKLEQTENGRVGYFCKKQKTSTSNQRQNNEKKGIQR
jgi:hypothetical protein